MFYVNIFKDLCFQLYFSHYTTGKFQKDYEVLLKICYLEADALSIKMKILFSKITENVF